MQKRCAERMASVMQTYKIAVIAGDGIGPEVISEGKKPSQTPAGPPAAVKGAWHRL